MPYDPSGPPPRSVCWQRRLEAGVQRVLEWFTPLRFFSLLLALMVLDYVARNGLPSASSSRSTDASSAATDALAAWLASLTAADVAFGAAAFVGFCVGGTLIIAIHELCHLAAFNRYGAEAYWTVNWLEIGPLTLYGVPVSGLCWPRHQLAAAELTWTENAVVSLAPLAFSAAVLLPVVGYHVAVAPVNLDFFAIWILALTGPSPPDYASLFESPRERWEELVEFAEGLTPHRSAEGFTQP